MIVDFLLQLWYLIGGETAPEYIIEALNWFGFAMFVLFILSPIIVVWIVFALFGKAGRYD